MALTVDLAFSEFMSNVINLDSRVTANARLSRDNLLNNIKEFDNVDFFDLCDSYNLHFGSFARKTKCRELDDIDMMIGIAANGATYYPNEDAWNNMRIKASTTNQAQRDCTRMDGTLNSTQVVNRFKNKLENVREYLRSEVKRTGEAVVLNLKSKDWVFDIVPCFYTSAERDGRTYYLIPNGNGNWKKTDPTIDREVVTNINQSLDGKVLELIRLFKKWNRVKNATTLPSYLLETIIINYCHTVGSLSAYIDERFRDALPYLELNIYNPIYDIKNIQGDINSLSPIERSIISSKARNDYEKANNAIHCEIKEQNQRKAINIWREVFGGEFPIYG